MCRLRDVDVQYRSNLHDYNQWEQERREMDERTIHLLRQREHKGFKVPGWVAALGALGILGALVWVFRAVVIR